MMFRTLILLTGILPLLAPVSLAEKNDADDWGTDYATGGKLYNQSRLGEAYDNFDKSVQRKQNSKEAEAYLLQIRNEVKQQAQKLSQERTGLNFNGDSPESALSVVNVEKDHIQVTLRTKYLFDENAASLKNASLDVLNRVSELLKRPGRVELTLVDEVDDMPGMKDIDAERALLVFSLLNFKKTAS